MKEIPIQIKDKIAVVRTALPIVCGNSDYVAVFTFIGDDWSAYPTKTARFVYGNEHIDVVFTGDRCDIPPIPDAPCVEIGVYAGDIKTSTPAYVRCLRSITSGNGSPADPPESVYNQLMEQLKDLGELSDEELAAAIEAYFAENPVEVPVTSVNGMTGAVTLVADNVGALNGKAVTYWSGVKNNDLFSILTIHSCGIVRNRTLDAPDGMAFPVFVICGNLSSGIREFSVIDNEGKCYSCEASLSSSKITKCKLVVNMAEYAKTADIPDWALADTKPTYTAAEVGAQPTTLIVEVTESGDALTANVSFNDIVAAHNSGKDVKCLVLGEYIYRLIDVTANAVFFEMTYESLLNLVKIDSENTVTSFQQNLAVTKSGIETALGYTPTKTWYVTITKDGDSITADKTPEEIYEAYQNGFTVYAMTSTFPGFENVPFYIPCLAAAKYGSTYQIGFATSGTISATASPTSIVIFYGGSSWQMWGHKLVSDTDIVDNLTSDDTDKPLSAAQGKALKEMVDGKAKAGKWEKIGEILLEAEGQEFPIAFAITAEQAQEYDGFLVRQVGLHDGEYTSALAMSIGANSLYSYKWSWNNHAWGAGMHYLLLPTDPNSDTEFRASAFSWNAGGNGYYEWQTNPNVIKRTMDITITIYCTTENPTFKSDCAFELWGLKGVRV